MHLLTCSTAMQALHSGFSNDPTLYPFKGESLHGSMLSLYFKDCMKKLALLNLLFAMLAGCGNESVKVPPNVVWSRNPFGNVQIESIYPIFYKDKIIVSQNLSDGTFEILALSQTNGNIIWRCQNKSKKAKPPYYNLKPYVYNAVLILPCGSFTIAVDMEKGEEIWCKPVEGSAEPQLEGCGQSVFQTCYKDDSVQVRQYDCLNGEYDVVYSEKIPNGHKKMLRTPTPIFEDGQIKGLLLCKTEQTAPGGNVISTLSLLSMEDGEIIKKDTIGSVPKEGRSFTRQAQSNPFSTEMLLVLEEYLICYDAKEFKTSWTSKLEKDMLTSDIVLGDKAVYFPSEDGYVYKLDLKTGNIQWKSKISGTPSRAYLLGGYLNIVGGANGVWHIIDVIDGKCIEQILTPNSRLYKDIFWRRYFTVSKGEKLALATDGKEYILYSFK
jgi:outer membrane protein assembly factor BamB